jgi:hypothetical protein
MLGAVACLGGCGSSKPRETTIATVKQRLVAAGFHVASTPPSGSAVAALDVDVGDSAATFVILSYPSAVDAIASVSPQETEGVKAGRGLVEISSTRVYLLGVSQRLTSTERAEFKKAFATGESR